MRLLWLIVVIPALSGCTSGLDEPQEQVAIATTHPLAAQAAQDVLAAGGNAFDAAAVLQFVLNVVEPGMSGIGGGAFFLGYEAAQGRFIALDGRETAPAGTPRDVFADEDGAPHAVRGTAVGVPGTLALWHEVLQRLGTIGLDDALEPAAVLAQQGFPIDAYLADYIESSAWKFRSWPASAQIFLPGSVCIPVQAGYVMTHEIDRCQGGEPLQAGDLLVQPDLASTFRRIQADGTGVLYGGPAGQAVVDAVGQREGSMTLADLSGYRVLEREPVHLDWDGHEVVSFPAPSGGPVVAQALGILAPFELAAMADADRLHVLAETLKLVYADRGAYEADPDFVPQPPRWLDPDYLSQRRDRIDMARARSHPPGDAWGDGRGAPQAAAAYEGIHTTHFVIMDRQGNIASVTSTIESVFGSGMVVPGWGFFLNNEMTDFSTDPEAGNAPEGGKRPRSSMSPTIVMQDGQPVMAVGASGGPRIIVATLQVILNTLELDMPLDAAIAAPRVYSPESTLWHEGISEGEATELRSRGHDVQPFGHIANVQAILRTPSGWVAAADDRAAQGACIPCAGR